MHCPHGVLQLVREVADILAEAALTVHTPDIGDGFAKVTCQLGAFSAWARPALAPVARPHIVACPCTSVREPFCKLDARQMFMLTCRAGSHCGEHALADRAAAAELKLKLLLHSSDQSVRWGAHKRHHRRLLLLHVGTAAHISAAPMLLLS